MGGILQSKIVRYFLFGSLAASLQVVMLIGLVEILGLNKVAASTVAFYGAVVVNYFVQSRFTFRSTEKHWIAMPKFLGISTFGALINIFAFTLMLRIVDYVPAQCLSLLLVFLFNYSLSKTLVFKNRRH